MARHKHADVIIAWANGYPVQVRNGPLGEWLDLPALSDRTIAPKFGVNNCYRIKPETIKWRPYLCKFPRSNSPSVLTVTAAENAVEPRESWGSFVCWLSDWQETEI